MKKEVLVIVAHPDDETIWMGGTLLQNKWNITIISLCRKDDIDRAPRFMKACENYKAVCFMSDLEDEHLQDIEMNEVVRRINFLIKKKKYDYIFTHGENGEYGHKRHIDVHNAVRFMIENRMLECEQVFFFAYSKKGSQCHARKNSDKFIKLQCAYSDKKKNLIKKIYGFDTNSFEEKCCKRVEAFNLVKIK